MTNTTPPVQVPNSIRVPLDSLHADAEYLLARLLAGTLTREQVVGVIRDRIDAARLEIDALRMRTQADSQPALPKITADDRSFLHYNPNTDDIVKWVQHYASAAIAADRAMREQVASAAVAVPVMTRHRTKDGILHFLTKEQMAEEIIRLDAALAAAPAAQAAPQPAVQQWNDLIGKETHADADGLLVWRDEVDFAAPTVQAAPQQQELLAEIQRLQRALAFWLPMGHSEDRPLQERIAHDAFLLAGYYGTDEPSAYELGHVALAGTAAPVAQGDALPREDFAWMVVQEACETEPADEDDPECIRILRRDLKSAVLAAFLREDNARAKAKEGQSYE